MHTVNREYKESKLYFLSDIKIGNFFEYKEKLFIKLQNEQNHGMIRCWCLHNSQLFNINNKTKVYKCPDIEIKYNIESKYEENI